MTSYLGNQTPNLLIKPKLTGIKLFSLLPENIIENFISTYNTKNNVLILFSTHLSDLDIETDDMVVGMAIHQLTNKVKLSDEEMRFFIQCVFEIVKGESLKKGLESV